LAAIEQSPNAICRASSEIRNLIKGMDDGAEDNSTPAERLRRLVAINNSKSARKVSID